MNTRIHPLVLGAAFLVVAGCNQQTAPPPAPVSVAPAVIAPVAAPATTTVGTEIDDAVVTTQVKSALLANPEVKAFDIKVETRKGLVQLSGFVDNQAQIDRAITVTREVSGVKNVENGMTLKDGKTTVGNTVDDGIVTARVKSALLADPAVKSADIAVVTRKGEVQLSGFVNNQAQIDSALSATRATDGVKGVVSELSIKK